MSVGFGFYIWLHGLIISTYFYQKVASDGWYEDPIVIRLDTVSKELTNTEIFPTVVMCPKQTKSYIDEWGLVKVSLEMIEFTCNNDKESKPEKCGSYNTITQKLRNKAWSIFKVNAVSFYS